MGEKGNEEWRKWGQGEERYIGIRICRNNEEEVDEKKR